MVHELELEQPEQTIYTKESIYRSIPSPDFVLWRELNEIVHLIDFLESFH